MDSYQPRHIKFRELISIDAWTAKIYTISKTKEFNNELFYTKALGQLPKWLSMTNSFNAKHMHKAFLILHEATEGNFSIINWWVGENMLNTNVFFTNSEQPDDFKIISGDGLGPCIWELEIINHERLSWLNHILKNPANPDFESYVEEIISCEL